MVLMESSLTNKGQVTIPAPIRTRLGLKPRDRVVFEIDGDEVRLRPAGSRILAGYGAVAAQQQPEDFRRLREQFEHDVAADVVGEAESSR